VNDDMDAKNEPAAPRRTNGARSLRRWARRGVGAAIGLGAVATLVVAWLPRPVPVDVVRVARGDVRVTVDEDGRTRVEDRYRMSAPLTGHCARIELHAGDAVRAGDVLARILPAAPPLLDARARAEAEARVLATEAQLQQARSSIDRARVAADLAEREAARSRELAARGGVAAQALDRAEAEARSARQELESVRFAARVAEHELELARAAVGRVGQSSPAAGDQLELTAPADGVVLRVLEDSAGFVAAGTPLVEIGDPTALEVAVDVLTSDAVRIPVGAHVEIDRWGGDGVLAGRVRRVEPSAVTRTSALGIEEQRVDVVIDLVDPRERWSALGDGFRVEVRILVHEARGVLVVPATALFRRGEGWAAFVVRDGRAELAPVEVGARNGVEAEVRSGLTEGDEVIVHPSDRVVEGAAVEPRA
jgi:HlyD family secretion protein